MQKALAEANAIWEEYESYVKSQFALTSGLKELATILKDRLGDHAGLVLHTFQDPTFAHDAVSDHQAMVTLMHGYIKAFCELVTERVRYYMEEFYAQGSHLIILA